MFKTSTCKFESPSSQFALIFSFVSQRTHGVVSQFTFPPKMWTRGRHFYARNFSPSKNMSKNCRSESLIEITENVTIYSFETPVLCYFILFKVIYHSYKQFKLLIEFQFGDFKQSSFIACLKIRKNDYSVQSLKKYSDKMTVYKFFNRKLHVLCSSLRNVCKLWGTS